VKINTFGEGVGDGRLAAVSASKFADEVVSNGEVFSIHPVIYFESLYFLLVNMNWYTYLFVVSDKLAENVPPSLVDVCDGNTNTYFILMSRE